MTSAPHHAPHLPASGEDPTVTECFRELISRIKGEDPSREGLLDTPIRASRALAELTRGYLIDVPNLFTTFDSGGYGEKVTVRDIPVYSLCEHHLMPFIGVAHVSYIPDGRIVGLSKLARVVDCFARRLQVQERLTVEIADAVEHHLRPAGLTVSIEAEHFCMTMRGAQALGTLTMTSMSRGELRDESAARPSTITRGRR